MAAEIATIIESDAGTIPEISTEPSTPPRSVTANWEKRRIHRSSFTGQVLKWIPESERQTELKEDIAVEEDTDTSISMTPRTSLTSAHRDSTVSLSSLKPKPAPKLDAEAQRIIRVQLARQILTDLRQVQEHCTQPTMVVYVDSLLRTMRTMFDLSPFDPYVEIVMALHDALAFENNWQYYNPTQYEGAYRILKNSIRRQRVTSETFEKAILELTVRSYFLKFSRIDPPGDPNHGPN